MRVDVFRDFRANKLRHASVFYKERRYRIGRHFLLCPMNHSEEKWCFTVVICGRMKLAQIGSMKAYMRISRDKLAMCALGLDGIEVIQEALLSS